MNDTSDIVIIGGGVTGCAAAYYLSSLGVSSTITFSFSFMLPSRVCQFLLDSIFSLVYPISRN